MSSCSRPIGCCGACLPWRAAGGINHARGRRYAHRLPHVLPGGELVLFTVAREVLRWDDAQIVIRSITTGEQKVLLEDAADARYVPGHLVFVRRGALMAAPFDVSRREVGGPVTLVEDVMQAANARRPSADSGAGQFAVAGGALVYASGGVAPQTQSELVWVDRMGNVEPLGFSARDYVFPRLSPDGKRLTFFNSIPGPIGASGCTILRANGGASRRQKSAERLRSRWTMRASSFRHPSEALVWIFHEACDRHWPEGPYRGQQAMRPGSWSAAHKTWPSRAMAVAA